MLPVLRVILNPSMATKTLFIRNVADNICEDDLSIYFQSRKKSGGGDIIHVSIDKRQRFAEIEFEDASGMS